MALAASLIPGFKYRVLKGLYEDEVVTIVDNTIIRAEDDPVNQRKIKVAGPHGEEIFMLPRLLSDTPEGFATAPAQVVTVPTVAAAPEYEPSVAPMTQQQASGLLLSHMIQPITDPMDERLDHLRPSKAKVKAYINRIMADGSTDVEMLLRFTTKAYRKKNQERPANIMLKGETQSGKTMLVEVLAVEWSEMLGLPKPMPVFTLSGSSGITDFDLFGQMTSYMGELHWLPGLVELAALAGGILYLDEINAFDARVTSSLHPLADHRHEFTNRNKAVWKTTFDGTSGMLMPETVNASYDLWIIGTYNEGYKGMGEMNEAFINRFRHIRWDYDKAIEAKLIDSQAVRLLGDYLRLARQSNQLRTPVGTTALANLEQDILEMGIALGVQIFTGMFKANEIPVVEEILEARSIFVMLTEEQRQREAEALVSAP